MRGQALVLLFVVACAKEKPLPAPANGPGQCLADRVNTLRMQLTPNCKGSSCRQSCLEGSPSSCMVLGFWLQQEKKPDEATRAFARACELGAGNGCTNYAAALWADAKGGSAQQACAERLFKLACDAKDAFACGMVSRLLIEDTTPPRLDEAKALLEKSCAELRGFPCRVLALHLEDGKLGTAEPARIAELLALDCEGGDPDGCGAKTAAETFH